MKKKIKIYELVQVYELEPISLPDPSGERIIFRIEIFEESSKGLFSARISRVDTFRLQPTFPQVSGKPVNAGADHAVVVSDDAMSAREITAKTGAAALEAALKRIKTFFKVEVARR